MERKLANLEKARAAKQKIAGERKRKKNARKPPSAAQLASLEHGREVLCQNIGRKKKHKKDDISDILVEIAKISDKDIADYLKSFEKKEVQAVAKAGAKPKTAKQIAALEKRKADHKKRVAEIVAYRKKAKEEEMYLRDIGLI